jgi:uncharacterized protein (DUF934 family)
MRELIRAGLGRPPEIVTDRWQMVADLASLNALPQEVDVIVPLALWRGEAARWPDRPSGVGVLLNPDDDPLLLEPGIARLQVVAIEFPVFTDGRGYSLARLVRERLGFRGELRAVGDVQRDQLFYLLRCGFDAFALAAGKPFDEALGAFHDFTEAYQAGADQPIPLYRRRILGMPFHGPRS